MTHGLQGQGSQHTLSQRLRHGSIRCPPVLVHDSKPGKNPCGAGRRGSSWGVGGTGRGQEKDLLSQSFSFLSQLHGCVPFTKTPCVVLLGTEPAPSSCAEALRPRVTGLGGRAFKEVTEVK